MINKVTLVGHLGGDPEITRLENGTPVGRFSLATNEGYKDENGEWKDLPTEWHNCVVWREKAESAEKQLKKGMLVYVEGKIGYRKYTDKNGIERTSTDITLQTFRKMEKSEKSSDNFPTTEPPQAAKHTPQNTEKEETEFDSLKTSKIGKTYVVRSGVQKDKIIVVDEISSDVVKFQLDRKSNEMPISKFNQFFELMDEYVPFDGNKAGNPDDLPF